MPFLLRLFSSRPWHPSKAWTWSQPLLKLGVSPASAGASLQPLAWNLHKPPWKDKIFDGFSDRLVREATLQLDCLVQDGGKAISNAMHVSTRLDLQSIACSFQQVGIEPLECQTLTGMQKPQELAFVVRLLEVHGDHNQVAVNFGQCWNHVDGVAPGVAFPFAVKREYHQICGFLLTIAQRLKNLLLSIGKTLGRDLCQTAPINARQLGAQELKQRTLPYGTKDHWNPARKGCLSAVAPGDTLSPARLAPASETQGIPWS